MICLLSGVFSGDTIPYEVVEYLKKLKAINFTFIASDFDDYKMTDRHSNSIINELKNHSIIINEVNIIDNRLNTETMIKVLKNTNVIFLLGGNTLKQIDNIKKNKLNNYIKNVKNVIGVSAGSINLAKKVVLPRDVSDNIPNLSIYGGIGVVNINVEPHCEFENKDHWNDIIEASYYSDIIIMKEGSYIIINNNETTYYGYYVIMKKGICYKNNSVISYDDILKEINND